MRPKAGRARAKTAAKSSAVQATEGRRAAKRRARSPVRPAALAARRSSTLGSGPGVRESYRRRLARSVTPVSSIRSAHPRWTGSSIRPALRPRRPRGAEHRQHHRRHRRRAHRRMLPRPAAPLWCFNGKGGGVLYPMSHRVIRRRRPRTPGRARRPRGGAVRSRAVLRPEQGPVPGLRLQGPEDRDTSTSTTTRRRRRPSSRPARMAERWYARLSRLLNHRFAKRQPLILYASHPHFEQTNVLSGFIGEGTGGVTEVLKRRVVMPLAGPLAETDHVLGHELVHAFQFDMTGRGGHHQRVEHPQRAAPAAVVHRGHGRVPVRRARWTRTPRCGCATPSRREQAAHHRPAQRPRLLPLPLRPGALVLRRRPLGRRGGGAGPAVGVAAAGRGGDPGVGHRARPQGAVEAVARGDPRRLRARLRDQAATRPPTAAC